jgi:hypothetical protein
MGLPYDNPAALMLIFLHGPGAWEPQIETRLSS